MSGDLKRRFLHSALREIQAIYTSPVRLPAMAIAIVLLAISGPFGTLDYDPATRMVYWTAVVVLTYAAGQVTGALVYAAFETRGMPMAPRILLGALAASVPTGAIVIIATWIAEPASAPNPLTLWFYAFAVSLALVTLIVVVKARLAPQPIAEPRMPDLLARLPLPKRGRLLHLEVTDHYVEVSTEKGKSLLLLRLSDAIRETAPVKGLQVHRSHWVALDAVRRSSRQAGKPVLELEDGAIVPVSRSFRDAAKAAGLL